MYSSLVCNQEVLCPENRQFGGADVGQSLNLYLHSDLLVIKKKFPPYSITTRLSQVFFYSCRLEKNYLIKQKQTWSLFPEIIKLMIK